jgi:O-antigen/teichoic acid export membrane protein
MASSQPHLDSRPTEAGILLESEHSILRSRMLRGSVILLTSTGLVSGTNFLYNIAIARGLGPAGFGHATAIYTLLMLLSAVTLAYQLVCSKLVAKTSDLSGKVAIYRDLRRRSWQTGLLLGALIIIGSSVITQYLHLPAPRDIILLGFGTAVYVPLGVRRGMLQGTYDFSRLAVNFVLEAVIKIIGALVLLHYGLGVTGVIAAVVASIAIAYATAGPSLKLTVDSTRREHASFREGMQAIVFFVGQVIISNLDILLVKHYFVAEVAGLYAAVALVGRVVYMASWSIISSMFPVSAAIVHKRTSQTVLSSALWLVVSITSLFTLATWLAPPTLWRAVLGATFLNASNVPFSSLIAAYSAMTSVYSVAVVLLTYEMSRRIANATWIQLAFSGLLPAGIALFHDSLHQVIMVQLLLMFGLLAAVSVPFWPEIVSSAQESPSSLTYVGFSRVRCVSESEVVAEFLKAEFYQSEFNPYREKYAGIVFNMDLTNEAENAIRKILLFRRRGRLWRELPSDTQWWEIELQPSDLPRVRAFPRKQWRKFAEGDFHLTRMIDRIRATVESQDPAWFSEKMRSLAADLRDNRVPNSVLLIGVDENSPLTIIEGNHRMAAAMLLSPEAVSQQFRFYCGLSPNMTRCCWYRTDLRSLAHYARNIIRYMLHDQDYFIQRSLRAQGSAKAQSSAN